MATKSKLLGGRQKGINMKIYVVTLSIYNTHHYTTSVIAKTQKEAKKRALEILARDLITTLSIKEVSK